jgi:hypothetical protein
MLECLNGFEFTEGHNLQTCASGGNVNTNVIIE